MRVKLGIEALDGFLGGINENTSILIRGVKGSGKTTVCTQFLLESLKKKEECLLITNTSSVNKDLRIHHKKGNLTIIKTNNFEGIKTDFKRIGVDPVNSFLNTSSLKKTAESTEKILNTLKNSTSLITLDTTRMQRTHSNIVSDSFPIVLELSKERDGHYGNIIEYESNQSLVGKAVPIDDDATLREVKEFFR